MECIAPTDEREIVMLSTLRLVLFTVLMTPLLVSANPTSTNDDLISRVRHLASDELAGRDNGSNEALVAADSIRDWLIEAGAEPGASEGWFQDFPLAGEKYDGMTGRNILGRIPGHGELADRYVVIGAHYDHLGRRLADDGVTVTGIYNGAEDNASGVSVLIEMAAEMSKADPDAPRRTVLFAAFAGEEIGLLGSRWLVDHLPIPLDRIDLMLNLDSVGRFRDDRLYVGGVGSAEGLRDHVNLINRTHKFDLQLSDGGWDASDHVSFNTAGVPVLFLFTGPHPQYHSVDDTWDLITVQGMQRVSDFAWDIVDRISTHSDALVYQAVADLSGVAPSRGKKRAWLGTIPDFVDDVVGVRLAGVMPNSPAAEAGLAKGDVVTAIGEVEVTSLKDLTVALQTHGEGQMVDIRFVRDEEERVLPVTLRPRPR